MPGSVGWSFLMFSEYIWSLLRMVAYYVTGNLDHKEGRPLKNLCLWIVVLEEALESPLDCKENKPINSKGNPTWVFTERTDPEVEAPILWPSHEKRRHLGKDLDVRKMWWQEEKAMTEDELAGRCLRSNQHEFDTTGGSGPWGHKSHWANQQHSRKSPLTLL